MWPCNAKACKLQIGIWVGQVGAMEGEAGHAVQQLARLTRRRDNLASLVERLSVLDGLSAGAAALGLLLQVRGRLRLGHAKPDEVLVNPLVLLRQLQCTSSSPDTLASHSLQYRCGSSAVQQTRCTLKDCPSLQGGDYGAALDVLADLQAGLAGDPLHGLACFRSVLCPSALAASYAMHLQSECTF